MRRNQKINLATMIFIVGEAFVNLSARDLRKTIWKRVDRFTVLQKTDHIVNADAGSFDRCRAAANVSIFHNVAVRCLSRHLQSFGVTVISLIFNKYLPQRAENASRVNAYTRIA